MLRAHLATLIATVLLVAGPPALAQVEDRQTGPDNVAVAINDKDGFDLFKLAFSIDRVMRSDADPDNAAIAASSCDSCTTTAIAIQVVLLMTPPDGDFSPLNMAVAVNEQCTSCETVALAYQIILQTDGPVIISAEGQKKIQEIIEQIRDLEGLDLSPEDLATETDLLVDELVEVFNEELRTVGPPTVDRRTSASPAPTTVPTSPDPGSSGSPATSDPSATSSPDGSPPAASDAPATSTAP